MYSPVVRAIAWLESQPKWCFQLLMTLVLLLLATGAVLLGLVAGAVWR